MDVLLATRKRSVNQTTKFRGMLKLGNLEIETW
jgi:hypothetical protein